VTVAVHRLEQKTEDPKMKMSLEEAIGTVIRLLNPYTNGSNGSMTIGTVNNHSKSAVDAEIGFDVRDVRLEIDDYHDSQGEWLFKGSSNRIARAVKIEYRHTVNGEAGRAGILPTEHLLIGYAGSNGGS
jgi:hypothetical protein